MLQKRDPEGSLSSRAYRGLAVLLRIIDVAAYLPQVGIHGLFAGSQILLSQEVKLVLTDELEVTLAGVNHGANRRETLASGEFFVGGQGGTVVTVTGERIDSLTIGVLGWSRTVGHHQITAVAVPVYFLRFLQGALDILNTRDTDFCFCHFARAMAQNDSRLRRSYDLSPCSRSSVGISLR